MEAVSMFVDLRVLYSFIGRRLDLILLGVGLVCLGEALWITLKMRDEGELSW